MAGRGVRREVAEAARKLLREKVDLVADLAEAGVAVDVAEEAVRTAQEAVGARQAVYSDKYRTATAAGWTDDELTQLGCPADRGNEAFIPRRRTRRRGKNEPAPQQEPASPPPAQEQTEVA